MKTTEDLIEDKLNELGDIAFIDAEKILNVTVNVTGCSSISNVTANMIKSEYIKLEQLLPNDSIVPDFLLERFIRITKKAVEATSVKNMFQNIANEYDSIHDYFLTMIEASGIDITYIGDYQLRSDASEIIMGFIVMRELYDIPYNTWFKRSLR